MNLKCFTLILICLLGLPWIGHSLPPSAHPPKPEAKFVPNMGVRSWELHQKALHEVLGDLDGSKPIKAIRSEIKHTMKDTQKFIKAIDDLDAREAIALKDRDQYRRQAEALAARYQTLSESLNTASIAQDASAKKKARWIRTRKSVLRHLTSVQLMLEGTADSLDKMSTEP